MTSPSPSSLLTNTPEIEATITNKGLSLIIDGDPVPILETHPNYDYIVSALRNGEFSKIPELVDVAETFTQHFVDCSVKVVDGEVFYKDEVVHNSVTDRMLDMVELGLDPQPLAMFLDNLYDNPSNRSIEQLHRFLEACDLPITKEGHLLAYKAVRGDYWDAHTGRTFRNTVGSVIEMDRNKVDDDPARTCSHGLHVCSQAYGKFSERLLLVSVNPRDVVSVPRDYRDAKMRVCRYTVLKEVENFETFEKAPVYEEV